MHRLLAAVLIVLLAIVYGSGQGSVRKDEQKRSEVEYKVREGSAPFPSTCTPEDVRDVVIDFLDAFNAGDQARLKGFFGEGFQWYSVTTDAQTHVALHQVADVFPYFAARHAKGEVLQLQKLDASAGAWHGQIDIAYNIKRSAEDLAEPLNVGGKGVVNCTAKTISVWSMGPDPALP